MERKYIHPECLGEFVKTIGKLYKTNPHMEETERWNYAAKVLAANMYADTQMLCQTLGVIL